MTTTPLTSATLELLRRPNPAVMATVTPSGAPVSVATWYLWDDESQRVLLNLDAGRARLRHLQHDPRVSLTVLDTNWYHHVSLRGEVELVDDPDLADIDRLARHYTDKPYVVRDNPRVSAWMTVTSSHVWPPR